MECGSQKLSKKTKLSRKGLKSRRIWLMTPKSKHVNNKTKTMSVKEFHYKISNCARDNQMMVPIPVMVPINYKSHDNIDNIADLYQNVDLEYRRNRGQFFTPPVIAELMVSYGLDKDTKTILDPTCGFGIFMKKILDAGYNGKIIGIDIDPIMINSIYLDIKKNYPKQFEQLQLYNMDYLLEDDQLDKADVLICNPPYVNFHDFDRNVIHMIKEKYGVKFSMLTNLYALFIVKAKYSVRHGGKIVFITPSEFFYTGYGKTLKKFMVENFTIEQFITFNFDKTVFDNALTTSTISILINKKPNPKHTVKFIKTSKIFDDIKNVSKSNPTKGIYVNTIKQTDLNINKKWQNYFSDVIGSGLDEKMVPLHQEAKVKRGIATGSNEFFTLSNKDIDTWGIEDRFLVPVISKASQIPGYKITNNTISKLERLGHKMHLLYCFSKPSKNLQKYIEHGEKLKIDEKYICAHRNSWYSMEKRNPAPILSTVFSRNNMRFIYNKTDCLNLAAYHGIYPNYIDKEKIKALLCYLNSNICRIIQKQNRREYGNGLHKFEPGDLSELPVIPISCMSRHNVKELSSLFMNMTKSELNDKSRKKIDDRVYEIVASI